MTGADSVFSALAHPVRREILDRLLEGPQAVNRLSADHGITPGAISQHLKLLEQAGMIQRTLDGRRHLIELNESGFRPALSWAEKYSSFWGGSLESLGKFLAQEETDGQ